MCNKMVGTSPLGGSSKSNNLQQRWDNIFCSGATLTVYLSINIFWTFLWLTPNKLLNEKEFYKIFLMLGWVEESLPTTRTRSKAKISLQRPGTLPLPTIRQQPPTEWVQRTTATPTATVRTSSAIPQLNLTPPLSVPPPPATTNNLPPQPPSGSLPPRSSPAGEYF